MKQKIMLESDKIWEKIRPNMMAKDDLLLAIFARYIEREFQKSSLQSHKLKVQKLYSILSKIGGKELLVTPKNYLQVLFGVTNCGILQI